MRNYDESKKSYDELLGKTMQSSLATSLNRQQQGDQFRIIDPPSLPEKASFPDRFKFSLAVWARAWLWRSCSELERSSSMIASAANRT